MKKALAIMLFIAILFATGCNSTEPELIEYDTFFSDEELSELHLDDMPRPELRNSVLYQDDDTVLYLNLTDDEFSAYTKQVAEYILSRDDIYNKGLFYTYDTTAALMFFPVSYEVYIPIEDNREFSKSGNRFAFSTDATLNDGLLSNQMGDTYCISIQRSEGRLESIDFTYNAYVTVDEVSFAAYETCAKEHKHDTRPPYPVPNTDILIDVNECVYCGAITESDSYGGYGEGTFTVTITEGAEYVHRRSYLDYRTNPNYSGDIKHIRVLKTDGQEYTVTVNGFEIPMVYEEDGYLNYGFIMPKCDVEITVECKNSE